MSVDINVLKAGDKVYYQPPYYLENSKWSNGVVKRTVIDNPGLIWVVFHCDGQWENFMDYTGQLTPIEHLYLGWKDDDTI